MHHVDVLQAVAEDFEAQEPSPVMCEQLGPDKHEGVCGPVQVNHFDER